MIGSNFFVNAQNAAQWKCVNELFKIQQNIFTI